MTDREGSQDREYAHLILLCKNETGYQNLMFLSSEAFLARVLL
jgi:DNA polymerase III alpha subunit